MGRDGRGVKSKSEKSIQISFQFEGKQRRETIPLPPTAANLKRAEQHRANILYEISRGTFDYAQVFPNSAYAKNLGRAGGDADVVSTFLKNWFKEKRLEIKASTEDDWDGILERQIIPHFGVMRLRELTRDVIIQWLKSLDHGRKKPLSNKTLANHQTILRQALSSAVEKKLIDTNPLAGYTYSRKIKQRVEVADIADLQGREHVDPFSSKEQLALLLAAAPQMRNYLKLALWTGLRTSELIALNWQDIDWKQGVVRVWKAMTRGAKGSVESTKTAAGRREVKLLPPALEALNAQKDHTYLAQKAIFHDPRTGERWEHHEKVWEVWQTVVRKSKVRYRNPYQTRHTYASMMLSAGEHPMWVAKQMGHADQTMISRVYGRWMPEADRGAGERAVAMFGGEESQACYSSAIPAGK